MVLYSLSAPTSNVPLIPFSMVVVAVTLAAGVSVLMFVVIEASSAEALSPSFAVVERS